MPRVNHEERFNTLVQFIPELFDKSDLLRKESDVWMKISQMMNISPRNIYEYVAQDRALKGHVGIKNKLLNVLAKQQKSLLNEKSDEFDERNENFENRCLVCCFGT